MSADCLFCRIARREIPADIVLETDELLAFRDVNPQAPLHVLVIPKRHVATLNELQPADASLVGALVLGAQSLARREGYADTGYRLVLNCNAHAGQTVFHVHLHLLAGRALTWPPG